MKAKRKSRTLAKDVLHGGMGTLSVLAMMMPLDGSAQVPRIYGGGSVSAADAYVGSSWVNGTRQVFTPDPGSLFDSYRLEYGEHTSYCPVDFGLGVLDGAFDASNFCHAQGNGSKPVGFGAADADANFIASESPLQQADYDAFLATKPGRGEPVQIPAMASAIAVIYNNADPAVSAQRITLTEAQICGIYAGQITDWNQLNAAYASKPITLFYLTGTTNGASFAFSNHLSYVCPTTSPAVNGFSTQVDFSMAFPGSVPPPNALDTGQNGLMVGSVDSTDGAIGYTEIADAMARRSTYTHFNWAKVSLLSGRIPGTHLNYRQLDPSLNTQIFSIDASNWHSDEVLVLPTPPATRATLAPIGAGLTQAGCSLIIDPDSYATAGLNDNGDYKVYPITNVSYLMAYSQGNGDDAVNAQNLLLATYTSDIRQNTDTIGAGTGYYWLYGKRPTAMVRNCVNP